MCLYLIKIEIKYQSKHVVYYIMIIFTDYGRQCFQMVFVHIFGTDIAANDNYYKTLGGVYEFF